MSSHLEQSVVLVGLMGAGKSTVGHRLARKVGVEFRDMDQVIEEETSCSISDIFALHGEAYFRELEQKTIGLLLDGPPMVIATGGGAFMQPAVRDIIMARSISIWLDASLETLVERVSRRNTRPLLEQGDKREIMKKLMEERNPIYAKARYRVESSAAKHDTVVNTILLALTPHLIRDE